jgi:two-component system sensor histidine kinase/response regulator
VGKFLATGDSTLDVPEPADEGTRKTKGWLEQAVRGSQVSIWEFTVKENGELGEAHIIEANDERKEKVPADYVAANTAAVAAEDRARVFAALYACIRGETNQVHVEYRAIGYAEHDLRWRLGRGRLLRAPDGSPISLVGTSVDITEFKRVEAELQRAREAAESANRAKDEFLANVSHEIRTPMNAIMGLTELALDAAQTEHQRRLLSTVKSAGKNLLAIINDLLDFSKISAGKLVLDQADFSLRVELGDTVRALAARAHRKGLELVCHVHPAAPDTLFGDAGRLRQVLTNLVGNAIKFTAQGEVVVEVRAASGHATADDVVPLVFTVRDTGIGIARDKQGAIFRAFEQEDASTTRKYGGTGLGLTIAAQLAALIGGELSVESEPGKGSTFAFTARFARSARPDLAALPSSSDQLEGRRVLIVDDNETNRRILVEWLNHWKMSPTAVGDGRAAIDALAHAEDSGAAYSLLLLDGGMPDVDGVTLATEIRARFSEAAKRIVLLSSDDSPILPARSHEAGIQACLLKPVQQSELLEMIGAMLNVATAADPRATTARAGAVGPKRSALRVLVAEDNELNVAVLREVLSKRGHRVRFASDGRAALTLVAEGSFDLLLLDLHMPELDGCEVVKAIRECERATGTHLPIIALTARSSSRDRERSLAAGMDDFLTKPIEAGALWSAIDRVVAAFPPAKRPEPRLLDARAILRMCGGRADALESLSGVFRESLPHQIAEVRAALGDGDLGRLHASAHKVYGTLAAFSTIAGALALTLEDCAKRGEVAPCTELVAQLEAMCAELLEDTRSLTIDALYLMGPSP